MSEELFCSRHIGAASFFWYVLGPSAHRATIRDGELASNARYSFYFTDDGSCAELSDAFFSAEGAIVGNVRQLLEASRQLRKTIRLADENGGTWQREDIEI